MLGRSVITIHKLEPLADEILQQVRRRGWVPDLIVGIERGGAEIARAVSISSGIPLHTVRLQRPSTHAKSDKGRMLAVLMPRIPRWMADVMRRTEDRVLQLQSTIASRRNTAGARPRPIVADPAENIATAKTILLVDDAIDSGSTMSSVQAYLKGVSAGDAEIICAVVARTRSPRHQVVAPEIVLYEETLVRFPWALDYRPPRAPQ